MAITRRDLLRAGVAGGLAWTSFGALERAAAGMIGRTRRTARVASGDSVLVVVNLMGGNDGLNTVVPLRQYARYRDLRPTLGLARQRLLPLTGLEQDFAFNPAMSPLSRLFTQGKLAVIPGAGCPPDAQGLFDHEASAQNFLTGTTYGSAPPSTPSGWVGRFLDGLAPAALPAGISFSNAPLLLTGVTSSPLAIYALSGFGVYPTDDSEANINVSASKFYDGAKIADTWTASQGPIARMVTTFTDDGTPELYYNFPLGNIADPKSPHYKDMLDDWANGKYRKMPFTKEEIAADAEEHIEIGPQ